MARGAPLTRSDQLEIMELVGQCMIPADIARKLKRSPKTISNFIKSFATYGTKRSTGRPTALSPADKRGIKRELCRNTSSCGKIVKNLNLSLSRSTIWRENNVIFSDEKKINLDGPDCYKFYWHDLRKEKKEVVTRHSADASVMVWTGISTKGATDMAFIETIMNSEKYAEVLENYLLPFSYCMHGEEFIFQQNNAPVHKSNSMKQWFNSLNMSVMEWPARSPDLKPIESTWGMLARMVYGQGRQFDTVFDLKNCIKDCWEKIDCNAINPFIESMPKRCISVIQARGAKINY
ncbi:unnamed protein product [Agarophyton chilense]